jgi:hypothetical protein
LRDTTYEHYDATKGTEPRKDVILAKSVIVGVLSGLAVCSVSPRSFWDYIRLYKLPLCLYILNFKIRVFDL